MQIVKPSASRAVDILRKYNLPYSDNIEMQLSTETFEEGGQYGVEIPAINSFAALQATVSALKANDIYCTRFNETHGSFLLSDQEISDMLDLCAENDYGIIFGLGPRPEYDTKATFYRTSFGLELGRQINNNNAIAHCIDEAFRLCELGCRGITVYDLGVLRILSTFRQKGDLPSDLVLKASSHCMVSNPVIAQIFRECGADSITTAHDLGLPVLHEMRRLNPGLVLDIPTDVYKSKGGFIRWYELAEMVQIASPIFLKMGASIQNHPYDIVKPDWALERVGRVAVGLQYLEKNLKKKLVIADTSRFRCLPKLRSVTKLKQLV